MCAGLAPSSVTGRARTTDARRTRARRAHHPEPEPRAVDAEQIEPEAPLFGTELGLDSIDALEIALAVSKRYGFQLRSDNADNRKIFASLRALSEHVQQHRAALNDAG
jgi:acyl carrier protein